MIIIRHYAFTPCQLRNRNLNECKVFIQPMALIFYKVGPITLLLLDLPSEESLVLDNVNKDFSTFPYSYF